MKISARTDYALRAVIELAARDGETIPAPEIAAIQQIPRQFLDAILADLRRSGLVSSRRGLNGGFALSRPGKEITVAEVIRAVDGPLATVRGERPQNLSYEGYATALQPVWIALRRQLRDLLENVSIADIAEGTLPPIIQEAADDDASWT